uniref:phosphatidylglycerophosphatase n=1 Tax=Kalanchoe fedtschenkoi TaxID=63787 RepID=A0A7N0VI54_KALFE
MYIEEIKEFGGGVCGDRVMVGNGVEDDASDARKVLIGAGARLLFYPTLLYNLVRNSVEAEFRWWDQVDEFILLGAVPFPSDVHRLRELGVQGVVTLNEPYETLVSPSLYHANGIENLVIPTRDYCYAPAMSDICRAVSFIHENSLHGQATYVHCKAGRGRSTTIVLCYLVRHRQMTRDAAYDYVKSIRPRVRLAPAQWQAVQGYYYMNMMKYGISSRMASLLMTISQPLGVPDLLPFDDNSVHIITKTDLDGYDGSPEMREAGKALWADLSVLYGVRIVSQAAKAGVSSLRFCYRSQQSTSKLSREYECSIQAGQHGGLSVVGINVY